MVASSRSEVLTMSRKKKTLTESDHEAGIHHVPRVLGGIALDAAISPEVVFVDLRVMVAREGLEHLPGGGKEGRANVATGAIG